MDDKALRNSAATGVVCSDMVRPDRTTSPQEDCPPAMEDTFQRGQILAYLENIPLGYVTQQDHEVLDAFVARAQRHFAELDRNWEPSND